jgi:tRNA(fMet)-specific endonuclease VapC
MSFLIDTDICPAHLKQKGIVTNRFLQYTGGLHVSTVTLGELYTWALRAKSPLSRRDALRQMLGDMTVLDITADVAQTYGHLQAGLLDSGRPAPGMDLMIAATAITHNLTLVTHNTQDFSSVPGLRLVDWLVP